jgi:predicted ribosomally synthesized peptide with nif11-like leader
MSAINVKRFFEKVASDKSLQAKLKALHVRAGAEETAAVAKVAAVAGFKFAAKELAQARKSKAKKAKLSDVAGQSQAPGCDYSYCNGSDIVF